MIYIPEDSESQCKYTEEDGSTGIFLLNAELNESKDSVVWYLLDTDPPS